MSRLSGSLPGEAPAYSKPPQPPQDLSHGKDGWSVNVSFAPTFRHRFHFDGGHRVL